jgi:hypothetical protein
MLAQGVSDPYCRFIAPGEFASMKKYDVTGVGLNLGTGEEFVRKTVRRRVAFFVDASAMSLCAPAGVCGDAAGMAWRAGEAFFRPAA